MPNNDNKNKKKAEKPNMEFVQATIDSEFNRKVIENLLGSSIQKSEIQAVTERLFQKFGTLDRILETHHVELMRVEGVTEQAAVTLKLVLKIAAVCNLPNLKNLSKSKSIEKIAEFCVWKYYGESEESASVLLFDKNSSPIGYETISRGGVTATPINLDYLTHILYKYDAAKFVLIHNHPNGVLFPSEDDLATTSKIQFYMEKLNKKMIEHILVVNDKYFPILKALEGE